jgi:hypothetical protein
LLLERESSYHLVIRVIVSCFKYSIIRNRDLKVDGWLLTSLSDIQQLHHHVVLEDPQKEICQVQERLECLEAAGHVVPC